MNALQPAGKDAFDQKAAAARYEIGGFVERVEVALVQAGFGNGIIPWEAPAQSDRFHAGGAAAMASLVEANSMLS